MRRYAMRLVVHIGSHKAGSTSIQDYCCLNKDHLLRNGIHYPTGFFQKFPRQHSELRELIMQDRMDTVRDFFEQATSAARAHGAETVFISGEDLTALGPGLAHRFQVAAAKYFAQTRVVLIIRNKKDFFYSLYKHNLLYGPPTGEADFAVRQRFSPRYCYDAWQNMKNVSIQVISFEATKRQFLSAFFSQVFGLAVTSNIRSNRSLDYLTLQIMNSFLKGKGSEVERIMIAVSERHPINFSLPIEDVISENIDRLYPDEAWEIPGIDLGAAILEKRRVSSGNADCIELCKKMVDLFTELQRHFEHTKPDQSA
jgi:hypothetical protein